MGSDGTSFDHVTEAPLCVNVCGFYGTSATMNLCSNCFRDLHIKKDQTPSAPLPTSLPKTPQTVGVTSLEQASSSTPPHGEVPAVVKRCHCCWKRVDVLGFSCKCGSNFCATHRHPNQHNCEFDYKSMERQHIAKANVVAKASVVVKADKIQYRI